MACGQLDLNTQSSEAARDELNEALAAQGLYCEEDVDADQDEFWLWPENEEVFGLWRGLQTQWVVGMSGAVGLNYAGVESDLRMLGVRKKRQRQFYILIKHMEQAALEEWASKR